MKYKHLFQCDVTQTNIKTMENITEHQTMENKFLFEMSNKLEAQWDEPVSLTFHSAFEET